MSACNYLDVVPENTPTIDHAFANRSEAENFLVGVYSFLPNHGNIGSNPALTAGDEIWFDVKSSGIDPTMWNIARNGQGSQSPIANYFSSIQEGGGYNNATALFTGLSDCNIFLANIHKPYDLDDMIRKQWSAEVKFLKAYYHFWLMRMYGPIPIIRENIEVSEGAAAVQRLREPIDNVVEYIIELLDEAYPDLEDIQENPAHDFGRPTKSIARALQAQVLTYAASPLFNGCTPTQGADKGNPISIFTEFTDPNGVKLFPEKDDSKWQRAADALLVAINEAHAQYHRLYDFRKEKYEFLPNLSPETINDMQVRGAVTVGWGIVDSPEVIWGDTRSTNTLQRVCVPAMGDVHFGSGYFSRNYAPTLRIVKQFYTKNGIPIEDDEEWQDKLDDHALFETTRDITRDDRLHFHYSSATQHSAVVNFDREPRFYGAISFDRGTIYGFDLNGYGRDNGPDYHNMYKVLWEASLMWQNDERYPSTGYLVKKWINFQTSIDFGGQGEPSYVTYPFPIIRLADLYLMYAEALNEATPGDDNVVPNAEAYKWIDTVRARTGLRGVKESWNDHAIASLKNKPLTKGGLRQIIQRERLNELAFEGARFWDLRRWLLSKEYMNNKYIYGLNAKTKVYAEFYKLVQLMEEPQKFDNKHYFWPIKVDAVLRNPQLKQSPGWETYDY
jgi:hypothetical protein